MKNLLIGLMALVAFLISAARAGTILETRLRVPVTVPS